MARKKVSSDGFVGGNCIIDGCVSVSLIGVCQHLTDYSLHLGNVFFHGQQDYLGVNFKRVVRFVSHSHDASPLDLWVLIEKVAVGYRWSSLYLIRKEKREKFFRAMPVPRATARRGSSAMWTWSLVFDEMRWSRPRSNEPPPAR